MQKTDEEIISAIKENLCRSDICRKFDWCVGGASYRKINSVIKKYNLDISHFRINKSYMMIKYPRINKTCEVCEKEFQTLKGSIKEKTVCSKSCSNTLFRSGKNNGNFKEPYERKNISSYHYRLYFSHEELICKRCKYKEFDCAIDIHHIDENRYNNSKENLFPLCSNCHRGLHNGKWNLDELQN